MKQSKTLLITALLCGGFIFNAGAQDFSYEWGYSLGATGGFDNGKNVTTDADGNVILLSDFGSSHDADPGIDVATLTSMGGSDVAISKFDTDGNLIWVKSFGGPLNDNGIGLATDADGSIYVSGSFTGTVDFDPGLNTEIRTSAGGLDIYLIKLDANGDFQWVYTNGSAQDEFAQKVAVSSNGVVHLIGYFRNTIDFDPGAAVANRTAVGGADIFMLKLSSTGAYTSVYQAGGTADEVPLDIALDAANNVYITGGFQGTVDFDADAAVANLTSAGSNDFFVVRINDNNSFSWVRQIGGAGSDVGYAIAIDRDQNVLVAAHYVGAVDADPSADVDTKIPFGGLDMMVVKLDNLGNYIFSKEVGSTFDDAAWDICTDDAGNIFVTGFMRGTVDFDPNAGIQNLTVAGSLNFADQFFWKLDSDGNYLFAERLGGGNNDHCFAIHADDQFLYTTGYFNGTTDFDISSGVESVSSSGDADMSFMKHINCNPIFSNDVILSCGPITWIDGIEYTTNNNTAIFVLPNIYGCDSTITLNLTIVELNDQTVTGPATAFCDNGEPMIDLGNSQPGVLYSLIDQSTMSVVDGPTVGNAAALTFNGGNITTTTNYEVRAERTVQNALTFTGNSAAPTYVSLGTDMTDVFKSTNQVTAEAWINTTSTASLQTVVGNYQNGSMQLLLRLDQTGGSNKATFWVGLAGNPGGFVSVVGTTTIAQNTWYHIAGTYDGETLSIYVNGVLENTTTILGTIPVSNNEFRIGGGLQNNTEYFNGNITDVRIWNTVRSAAQIDANMDACIPGNESGLVALYNMFDGAGSTTLTDESVNGFNGVLTNMDANTSWNYTNLPTTSCTSCLVTMTQTVTATVNESTSGVDQQAHCDAYTWIDGLEYTADNNTATFTLLNAAGCDSIVTLDLTITATPAATAVDNGDGTLSATGNGTYQWIDCGTGNPIAGETAATFSPTANGDYAVVVTNGDCEDESDCVTVSTIGLTELAGSSFAAYPNPTTGVFTVSSDNALITSILVTDGAGRVILETTNMLASASIDLSAVKTGMYFITVHAADASHTTLKVMKH